MRKKINVKNLYTIIRAKIHDELHETLISKNFFCGQTRIHPFFLLVELLKPSKKHLPPFYYDIQVIL